MTAATAIEIDKIKDPVYKADQEACIEELAKIDKLRKEKQYDEENTTCGIVMYSHVNFYPD